MTFIPSVLTYQANLTQQTFLHSSEPLASHYVRCNIASLPAWSKPWKMSMSWGAYIPFAFGFNQLQHNQCDQLYNSLTKRFAFMPWNWPTEQLMPITLSWVCHLTTIEFRHSPRRLSDGMASVRQVTQLLYLNDYSVTFWLERRAVPMLEFSTSEARIDLFRGFRLLHFLALLCKAGLLICISGPTPTDKVQVQSFLPIETWTSNRSRIYMGDVNKHVNSVNVDMFWKANGSAICNPQTHFSERTSVTSGPFARAFGWEKFVAYQSHKEALPTGFCPQVRKQKNTTTWQSKPNHVVPDSLLTQLFH